MSIKRHVLQLITIIIILFSGVAKGQEQYNAKDFRVTLKPLGQYAIISFELKNNAKFYWREPGELGLPTKFNFSKSRNIKDTKVFWPVPELYLKNNVASYVYQQDTDFIVKLTPNDPNKDIHLDVDISFAICQKSCSTYNINLSNVITNDSYDLGVAMEALAKTPQENGSEGLNIHKVEQEVIDGKHWLNIEFTNEKTLWDPQIFLDLPEYVNFEPADFNVISSQDGQIIRIPFEINNKRYLKIEDKIYINLVADNGHSVELTTTPITISGEESLNSFIWILLMALLGGMILNVMPCVLPVLALKALHLIKLAGKNKNLIRKNLIAQSAGIVSTFICFALLTYGLQFLGYQTGLGIHFQQPFYLITMILVLSFIAINLLSKEEFSIQVPHFLVKIFHIKSEQTGILGFFASGVLSTLLAIPCTAPFVTIAIGFALTTDFLKMIIVFTVMGVGMSTPYIAMASFPKMAKFLPKPGPWMEVFKKILGMAVITTSIWLIYVVSTQLGYKAAITIFLLLLLIKFIVNEREFLTSKARTLILAVLIGLSYFLPHNLYMEKQYNATLVESTWQDYEPSAIDSLVDEGYVVVVNISASWCATCGLNKVTTLDNVAVINAMEKFKVIAMRADISKSTSSDVSNLMKEKNHHGIPYTLVYSKKYPKGKVLQTVLTPNVFISAIKEGL
ncbi:MAG: protein-disulfide reductase DsbD family protein [Rickettsiales bacterium]|jgi:suppressor for copper-sensitivity B|nr:protein-disulfide reductase DsbD family protein [Rickettsiales bacterium]